MKRLSIVGISLLLFLSGSLVAATPSASTQAKVALALEQALRDHKAGKATSCACGVSCTCTAGECGDPSCPQAVTKNKGAVKITSAYPAAPGPIEWALYKVQCDRAEREKMPLLLWVGETCPACESTWTEMIHARLSEDPNTGNKGPYAILARPDSLAGLKRVQVFQGIPSHAEVTAALNPVTTTARAVQAVPCVQCMPQMMSMPMPMMGMGGFGGGFGGGMMMGGCGAGG